jgi:hypothetical protein
MPSALLRPYSLAWIAALGIAVASREAAANPRPLPFTYPYETLPEGEAELEQYVDATPVRSLSEDGKEKLWEPKYRLQTEYEYGITDRLELGLYFVFANDPGGPIFFDGTKQRLRLRLAEQGDWPVDVALYGEVSEFHDELELEEKVIVAKRFGPMRVIANLWMEESFEHYAGSPELVFNPTAGVTYEVSPMLHVGAEYWLHAPLENDEPAEDEAAAFNREPHHYLGPAIMLNWGKVWWSNALYYRLDHASRKLDVGDEFGHVWIRSVLGISL